MNILARFATAAALGAGVALAFAVLTVLAAFFGRCISYHIPVAGCRGS
jgi:hypothetical protein